ncbi:MAG: hypothetical protein ACLFRV_11955 [Acidimicrobiales bacterium]
MSTHPLAGSRLYDDLLVDLAYEYDLSLPQARSLADLGHDAVHPGSAPEAHTALADPHVATTYIDSFIKVTGMEPGVWLLDAQAARVLDGDGDNAGVRYLLARVAELRGQLDRWRTQLDLSLALDDGYEPSLFDRGFLAFVEGDVSTATRLLGRIDDPRAAVMLHTLSHYPPRRSGSGRNYPCQCGSGAKTKRCCGVVPEPHPLHERVYWLWEKTAWWLRRPPQQWALLDLVAELADVEEVDDDLEAVTEVLHEEATEAIALLDADLVSWFVDTLGSLLPTDERGLLTEWVGTRHRLWRVEATDPGRSVTMVDDDTGRRVEAMNGSVSRCTQPGEIVFAAVVPTSAGWFLPCHHLGVASSSAPLVASWMDDFDDPLNVAAHLYSGIRRPPSDDCGEPE